MTATVFGRGNVGENPSESSPLAGTESEKSASASVREGGHCVSAGGLFVEDEVVDKEATVTEDGGGSMEV